LQADHDGHIDTTENLPVSILVYQLEQLVDTVLWVHADLDHCWTGTARRTTEMRQSTYTVAQISLRIFGCDGLLSHDRQNMTQPVAVRYRGSPGLGIDDNHMFGFRG
jgi:hypothetical protein